MQKYKMGTAFGVIILLATALTSVFVPTHGVSAITNASGGYTGTLDGDEGVCDNTFELNFSATLTANNNDDGNGWDYYVFVFVDALGNPQDIDIERIQVGETITKVRHMDPNQGDFNPPQARPFTGAIFDIHADADAAGYFEDSDEDSFAGFNWVIANSSFVFQDTIDPATLGSGACGDLPLLPAYSFIPVSVSYTHVSDIRINATSPVAAYANPGGDIAKNQDGDIWLPHDADQSGYDTYVVTDTAEVDGGHWVAIFLGNNNHVWVRLDQVTTP